MTASRLWDWTLTVVWLLLILAAILSVFGCVDRGACRRSHQETRTGYIMAGKVMVPTVRLETVCDEWECPSGQWREDVVGRICDESR